MTKKEEMIINLEWTPYLDSDGLVQYGPPEVWNESNSDYNNLTIDEIEIDDEDLPF